MSLRRPTSIFEQAPEATPYMKHEWKTTGLKRHVDQTNEVSSGAKDWGGDKVDQIQKVFKRYMWLMLL